jgi:hypothetical protein
MYMAKRLAFACVMTVLGTSLLLTACADDEDRVDDVAGGEAGEHTGGSKTAGSSSGGTSAGKGGSSTVGGEMQGGQGGAGAAGDAGMSGEGGNEMIGGAPVGGGASDGGAAGMGGGGGADNPPVTYACGSTTISRRLCSAYIAAECDSLPPCTEESPPGSCCTDCPAPVCPDCVPLTDLERQPFEECAACLAEYDRNLLCAIEPFEAGNLSEGVACFDMHGAYQVEACDQFFFSATQCLEYAEVQGECPATWPLPPG